MATTSTTAVKIFVHDDAGYLAWLASHRSGFVVNCHQKPVSTYLMLHRATCVWINPPKFKNWTTVGYVKACAQTRDELESWAIAATGGNLQPCKSCKPGNLGIQPVVPEMIDTAASVHQTSQYSVPAPDDSSTRNADVLVLKSGRQIIDPLARVAVYFR